MFARNLIILLFGIMLLSAPLKSFAADTEEPLVTIRFSDNNNDDYQKKLQEAVLKARQTKPSVFFDIITTAPVTKDGKFDKQQLTAAETTTKDVVAFMLANGVNQERIRTYISQDQLSDGNELKIFVR